jgi:hypothetical protein
MLNVRMDLFLRNFVLGRADDPKDRSLAPASALNTLGADLKIGRAIPQRAALATSQTGSTSTIGSHGLERVS